MPTASYHDFNLSLQKALKDLKRSDFRLNRYSGK